MDYDVFISHASENKVEVALPLANLLKEQGIRVWLDSFELKLGDSLRRSIDRGLAQSRFGIVILSPEFFRKEWPQRELDGLVTREVGTNKVILPIWHNISHNEIAQYSPSLADKLGASTSNGLPFVAQQVLLVIKENPPCPIPDDPKYLKTAINLKAMLIKRAVRGATVGAVIYPLLKVSYDILQAFLHQYFQATIWFIVLDIPRNILLGMFWGVAILFIGRTLIEYMWKLFKYGWED
jgi:hypothetical protein